MTKGYYKKVNLGMTLLAAFFLCGSSDISLKDIETAIIKAEYQQAKQLSLQMLSGELSDDQEDETRYYLGLCNLRLGDYTQAREIFTELTKKNVNEKLRDKAYLGLFDAYYIDEQFDQAYQAAERLLRVSPGSEFLSLLYLKHARASLKLAKWDEARVYLNKIIDQFPDSLEAHTATQFLSEKQYYAVQVGAFIDRKRAEEFSNELQQEGKYAYIVETVDQYNRRFYRVRVGQLALLDEAQKLKSELSQAGYPTEIYP